MKEKKIEQSNIIYNLIKKQKESGRYNKAGIE